MGVETDDKSKRIQRSYKKLGRTLRKMDIPLDLTREEREEQILVKAYETWGNEMADHMHGMFAFALWDESEEKLFCLRDQFGTKPFYYYETADGKLLYGTTIRKIMEQRDL